MTVNLNGTWKLYRNSDNFEEFLIGIGFNSIKRKIAHKLTPTLKIEQGDNKFHITASAIKAICATYTIGEEFDANLVLDRDGKGIARLEGDKFILEGTLQDGTTFKSVRYIENEDLVNDMQIGDFECKRWFRKT